MAKARTSTKNHPVAPQPVQPPMEQVNYSGYQNSPIMVSSPYSFNAMLIFLSNNAGLLLLGAAVFLVGFLSGSMYTENGMLKKGLGVTPTALAPSASAAPAPQGQEAPPAPLTDADWAEIQKDPIAIIGDKNAKVTMVEFTDYQCPFCSRFYKDTYGALVEKYVKTGKMKIIVRDQALPFHPNAKIAAHAARCAAEKGKFSEMHDELFANQDAWANLSVADATKKFGEYAATAGLNAGQLEECVNSGKYVKAIDADGALGTKVGAGGTPTFFIGKEMVVGAQPTTAFEAVIDKQL